MATGPQGKLNVTYTGLILVLMTVFGHSFAANIRSLELETQDRIIGGTKTPNHGRPYMALIRYSVLDDGQWYDDICGGNVVSEYWIVTAAHCMEGDKYSIHLGMNSWCTGDVSKIAYSDGHEERNIKKIVVHPEFNSVTLKNDIALIKMDKKVGLRKYIKTIRLPTQDPVAGSWMTVAGWGVTTTGVDVPFSCDLREVKVKVVLDSTCVPIMNGDDTHFCAGHDKGGKDSCQGDSGGGLVSKDSKGYVLEGLVSNGVGCGLPGAPAYYTKVFKYVPWIKEHLSTK